MHSSRLASTAAVLVACLPLVAHGADDASSVAVGWDGAALRGAEGGLLEVHMLLQGRVEAAGAETENWTSTASMLRARPLVRLTMPGGNVAMLLQAELVGDPRLLDARVDARWGQRVTVTLGQHIVPFSRAWNTPLPLVQMPERSWSNDVFSPGRSFGGTAAFALPANLAVSAGVYRNLALLEPTEVPVAPMAMIRASWSPLGGWVQTEVPGLTDAPEHRLSLGAAAIADAVAESATTPHERVTLTGDLGHQWRGYTLYAEGFVRPTDGGTEVGTSAQIGQLLPGQRVRVMTRGTWLDTQEPGAWAARLEPAVACYLRDSHAALLLRYREGFGAQGRERGVTAHGQVRF